MEPKRKSSVLHPRQIVLEAVDALELEADRCRQANEKAEAEVERLRRENDHLRQQLKEESDLSARRIQILDEEIRILKLESSRYRVAFDSESKRVAELEELRTNREVQKDSETQRLKDDLCSKVVELRTVCQEREAIRIRLEKSVRQNLDDRSMELLREVELLKRELASVRISKDEVSRTNATLMVNIKNLENLLGDRELQLKNETMRHSLLTKQFNSLMEENAALKERQRVKTTSTRFCGNDPALSVTTNFVFTDSHREKNANIKHGFHIGALPAKATPGESSERSLLRRKSSLTSGAGSDQSNRNQTVPRVKSEPDTKSLTIDNSSQSSRNSIRRSISVVDLVTKRVDRSLNRSVFTNTLPLIIAPSNGRQWRP